MLRFTSVSDSVRVTTDITHTVTIIRIHITSDLIIIDLITGRIIGMADIATTVTTIRTITAAKL
jgi:hypothetical protein